MYLVYINVIRFISRLIVGTDLHANHREVYQQWCSQQRRGRFVT
jgi:hypothetical protein